ncbi:serine/threonine protein kinase [candidate division CSSED10-310 bacterium]|uniref:Serine/threonine protein kinase n=1 Tax=candidate division CSSED10-310 bacterium TaxID=2855610 RepID=A0ABV6YV74_UNCC1
MNCIFCDTPLAEKYLYCSQCEQDRVSDISLQEANLLREGQLLARLVKNKYELIGLTHQDSLRLEFKAIYIPKGRTDLIQVLPLTISRDDSLTEGFHRLGKKWLKMKHRKILRPISSGKQGKLHFAVNVFPSGLRLSDIMASGIDIPLEWVKRMMKGLCFLVKMCHQMQLVHANIKPSSLFIDREGQVQLTNVGLLDPLPINLYPDCTPADISLYAAPEQLNGQKATPQSDFYSLALVAYQLCTTLNPFETEKEVNILYKNLHESVIPALALNSEMPIELSDIITKNLNKKQKDRSQAIDEFVKVIQDPAPMGKTQTITKKTETITKKTQLVPAIDHEKLIKEGKEYYRKGQFKKAVECWERFLESDSSNFAVQKYRLFALARLKAQCPPTSKRSEN